MLSAGEAADEVRELKLAPFIAQVSVIFRQRNHRSEASPSHMDVDPLLPSSPPLQIRTAHGESASRERVRGFTPPPCAFSRSDAPATLPTSNTYRFDRQLTFNEKKQVHFKLPPPNDLLVEFDP